MPEAAVYEDDRSISGEHYVRVSRKILAVQPEAITYPVKHRSNPNFGLGVLAFDAAHDLTAFLRRERVSFAFSFGRHHSLKCRRVLKDLVGVGLGGDFGVDAGDPAFRV